MILRPISETCSLNGSRYVQHQLLLSELFLAEALLTEGAVKFQRRDFEDENHPSDFSFV